MIPSNNFLSIKILIGVRFPILKTHFILAFTLWDFRLSRSFKVKLHKKKVLNQNKSTQQDMH